MPMYVKIHAATGFSIVGYCPVAWRMGETDQSRVRLIGFAGVFQARGGCPPPTPLLGTAVPLPSRTDKPLALVAEAEHPQIVGDGQPGLGELLDLRGRPPRSMLS